MGGDDGGAGEPDCTVPAVPMRPGADLRHQLLGRRALAAGQRAYGCADSLHAADVLERWAIHGIRQLGMDGGGGGRGIVLLRGGHEHHQLYGRHQWHYGRVCVCDAAAAGAGEWFGGGVY